mmetsp:Transcript_4598/g.5989  ORF Transcript_4598/g.5989 Transcript_4598/m.5989 type:complete len:365 (-) Transcript_4598:168-1262(-)
MDLFDNDAMYCGVSSKVSDFDESPKSVAGSELKRTHDTLYQDLFDDDIFQLLEDLEWNDALTAVLSNPDEAKVFVTKTSQSGTKVLFRRLPIHEACMHKPPVEVILGLLFVNFAGAKAKDNFDRTPLHLAFIHNADVNVIYLLLNAFPKALTSQDFCGKTAKDYALESKSDQRKEIIHLLDLSPGEVAAEVRDIVSSIKHHLSIETTEDDHESFTIEPTGLEAILEDELAQARIESDIAYSHRDSILKQVEGLREKVNFLEKQNEILQKSLHDKNKISEMNASLQSLHDNSEAKNAELNSMCEELKKTIESLNHQIESDEKKRKKDIVKMKSYYESDRRKMKVTITSLTDKLKRVNTSDDDTSV